MEVINKDLGLEFYVIDYEYPLNWAVNTIGKNGDWLLMQFNYIDCMGQKEFQSSALLAEELSEIKEALVKVIEGGISGYKGKFVDPTFTIALNRKPQGIVVEVNFKTDEKTYSVTETMEAERLEEFLEELKAEVLLFPQRKINN